jgi:hypothetical protein
MTIYYRCDAELRMYEGGLPICVACSAILSQKTKPELSKGQLKHPVAITTLTNPWPI